MRQLLPGTRSVRHRTSFEKIEHGKIYLVSHPNALLNDVVYHPRESHSAKLEFALPAGEMKSFCLLAVRVTALALSSCLRPLFVVLPPAAFDV